MLTKLNVGSPDYTHINTKTQRQAKGQVREVVWYQVWDQLRVHAGAQVRFQVTAQVYQALQQEPV